MKNCNICGKLSEESICKTCLITYVPLLKKFISEHPTINYMEAAFNKNLPVPRNVLYELTMSGLIKIKN